MKTLLGLSFLVLGVVAYGQERATDGPARVSSGTMEGQLLKRPVPMMNSWESALYFGIRGSGSVTARVTISETGYVEDVTLVNGVPGLADAVMRAYRDMVYRPYLLNGKPTRVSTTLTTNLSFGRPDLPEFSRAIGVYVPPVHWPNPFCDSPWAKETEFHKNVSAEVMAGLVERRVDPVPPPGDARGVVMLNACIGVDGRVEKVTVLSNPNPALRQPAADAVLQWRYRPYVVDGVAVPVITMVSVNMHGGG